MACPTFQRAGECGRAGEPVDFFDATDDDWLASVQSKLLGTTKVIKEAGKLMAHQ